MKNVIFLIDLSLIKTQLHKIQWVINKEIIWKQKAKDLYKLISLIVSYQLL